VLGGLWHGANWTFVLWGAFHGALLAINHVWRQWRGPRVPTPAGRFAGWCATFTAFVIGMVLFRAPDLFAARSVFQAMAGLGGAPRAEAMNVAWDAWGVSEGLISENFVRTWIGANWSVVGSLWTAAALAIMLLVPDTMELANYREGEPHSDWRRDIGWLAWRPSALWGLGLIALFVAVYAKLLRITEFLYYQF